jgi:hypothetical protein
MYFIFKIRLMNASSTFISSFADVSKNFAPIYLPNYSPSSLETSLFFYLSK